MTDKTNYAKLVELGARDFGRRALNSAASTPEIRAAMVVLLHPDGTPELFCSAGSIMEKALLVQMAQAYMVEQFDLGLVVPEPDDPNAG